MHLRTTDAQAVRKEYSEYMTTGYKGASEKRKLTHLSSEPQNTSSVEGIEIEFIHESEERLKNTKPSRTDVYQEIDTPSDNLNHQDTHVCENQDDILIHATNLSHTFAPPQFMAQHNYEGLNPTDTPSTVPTTIQASIEHTFNPRSAHSPMATQCNQSQYPTLTTTLHYPNSWHNTTVKTRIPLILQVQYQPLSKLPMITPSILSVLIT